MSTAIAETEQDNVAIGLSSKESFDLIQRAAKLLSVSTLVPKAYQNSIPNCVVALNMASRMGADPLMVMQNLYVVHGNPSWSSQFLISTFNTCGKYDSIHYKFTGNKNDDTWGCIAYAVEKASGEVIEGAEVTIALAKKEGWYNKTGSKWQTMPQQMLMYRSAAFLVRAYAPEIAMGLHTREEVYDTVDGDVVSTTVTRRKGNAKAAPLNLVEEIAEEFGGEVVSDPS
jgi:hypothetical protein